MKKRYGGGEDGKKKYGKSTVEIVREKCTGKNYGKKSTGKKK
jgi:hypothetical protein